MQSELITIKRLAYNLNIAEIRVWEMIRRFYLPYQIKYGETLINRSDANKFISRNPEVVNKWKEDFEYAKEHNFNHKRFT